MVMPAGRSRTARVMAVSDRGRTDLLESAAAALETGGRMVYSTCSLEQEENQDVIERFLNEHPEFRLLPLREDAGRLEPFFLPAAAAILKKDCLETLPDRDGTDGFFAAILVKTERGIK